MKFAQYMIIMICMTTLVTAYSPLPLQGTTGIQARVKDRVEIMLPNFSDRIKNCWDLSDRIQVTIEGHPNLLIAESGNRYNIDFDLYTDHEVSYFNDTYFRSERDMKNLIDYIESLDLFKDNFPALTSPYFYIRNNMIGIESMPHGVVIHPGGYPHMYFDIKDENTMLFYYGHFVRPYKLDEPKEILNIEWLNLSPKYIEFEQPELDTTTIFQRILTWFRNLFD